jgi:hypothetical protein
MATHGRDSRPDIQEEHHVDIARAEQVFHDLERRLSRFSQVSVSAAAQPHDPHSGTSTLAEKETDDVEKGEGRFNLKEYLSASNDANQKAGIKHKVSIVAFTTAERT